MQFFLFILIKLHLYFTNLSIYFEIPNKSMYTSPSVSIWEKRSMSKEIGLSNTYVDVNGIYNKIDVNDYDKILHVAAV